MNTLNQGWWDALKRLHGNWWYSPGDGLLHISKNHVSDIYNGRCVTCKAKAPASVKIIALLQEGFKK